MHSIQANLEGAGEQKTEYRPLPQHTAFSRKDYLKTSAKNSFIASQERLSAFSL